MLRLFNKPIFVAATIRRNAAVGIALCVMAGAAPRAIAGDLIRAIPQTSPTHPGNIFLTGEEIVIDAPPGQVDTWRAVDYDGKVVAKGEIKDGKAHVGPLPVGWYKIVRGVGQITNRTFVGVLERLRAPTPETSPICIDVAMAWFFPPEKMEDVANLCALAGINRVRDRLLWEKLEPTRGQFASSNQYDISATIQHAAGLQILQVNHLSPSWANPETRRFPPDLRDVYRFHCEMAKRWRGEVGAFEPWNEADIKLFGGHTGSEIATLQKAAYLGLKAGNPNVTACLNVFAIRRAATLKDFSNNHPWPYFDTYNLHHYEQLDKYPSLYADHRAVSGGKPMWVTECSIHVRWRGDEKLRELSNADLELQSERLTKTYVLALHEGAEAVFYFMLPHYTETRLQYGLLRADLSPRPGYVALAAVGRLLADAKPLGRMDAGENSTHAYLFRAKPDGKSADVLVAWSDEPAFLKLPKRPRALFDHLGRVEKISDNTLTLGRAPIYAVLADDSRGKLIPPIRAEKIPLQPPSPVVIQALFTEAETVLEKSAIELAPGTEKKVPVFLYNFGDKPVRGALTVSASRGLKVQLPEQIELSPGDRKELSLNITSGADTEFSEGNIRIDGDFGGAGKPVLSFQVVAPEKMNN